jgi:hypothetical protein
MIPDELAWFAIGALFGLALSGWPWHPRFSRYRRRMGPPQGSYGLLDPPPDVAAAINRQLDQDIAAELDRRRRRRGSTPTPSGDKPAPPSFPPPRIIREDFLP